MENAKIVLFWEGFPACGLLLTTALKSFDSNALKIVATKPAVPFEGLEEKLGREIHWLDHPDDIWQFREKYEDRNVVIHTGWCYPNWLKFDRYLKKRNNAKIVSVVDNIFKGDLRQYLGAFYFRLFLRKQFDACFVPGHLSSEYLRFLGMRSEKIQVGNYGAFEGIYQETRPIRERRNEFLFLGQLNQRKGVDVLIESYRQYRETNGSWSLRILGEGPLRPECEIEGVAVEGFTQPNAAAEFMNNAKVLILPSREDHWGTVICEAAACGMLVVGTKFAGASKDIIRTGINGLVLDEVSSEALTKAMHFLEDRDDEFFSQGSAVSKGIAKGFDSHAYANALVSLLEKIDVEA